MSTAVSLRLSTAVFHSDPTAVPRVVVIAVSLAHSMGRPPLRRGVAPGFTSLSLIIRGQTFFVNKKFIIG
ncbi:MAG: hypothetical protein HSCHL_2571 [Hydrogenibacillus schlegelii]|uniref:Uncharacterized protein n=1 Tax=Hydrogenibacillus schlegelii TaxID=1484 RepID=A0A2T5G3N4_HYDSH|nr:MAG: hypothetical protein HSCHL_2571 [Hydrogenibacillus schlegelii]